MIFVKFLMLFEILNCCVEVLYFDFMRSINVRCILVLSFTALTRVYTVGFASVSLFNVRLLYDFDLLLGDIYASKP